MSEYAESIAEQYGRAELEEKIFAAYRAAGVDTETLTRDDIASFDEFHIRGREATRELARLAEVEPGTEVLDVESGVGGPARTLAAEFGCRVTGLDLTEEYVRVAELLTERVGLADRVNFEHGDAMEMPFEDDAFDLAWMQHTSMNVADKPRLFAEVRRVLRPGGRLALYEILAGSEESPHFPVPWADDPSVSFLASPEELQSLLARTGFEQVGRRDVTAESLAWFRETIEAVANRPPDAPPPLGLNLLMGETTAEKAENVVRNLEEGRIVVTQAAFEAVE